MVILPRAQDHQGDPRRFVETIVSARAALGPEPLLYTPGLGLPSELATLVLLTVDVVDTAAVDLAAQMGLSTSTTGLQGLQGPMAEGAQLPLASDHEHAAKLLQENRQALVAEAALLARAVEGERAREVVSQRMFAHPWTVAAVRAFESHPSEVALRLAPVRRKRCIVLSDDDLGRPDIQKYLQRLEGYRRPPAAEVALLVPCSARKPYSSSRSLRATMQLVQSLPNPWAVHVIVVTSPLGAVPLDLEATHPAAVYDIPVTGTWSPREERLIRDRVGRLLRGGQYRFAAACVPGLQVLHEVQGLDVVITEGKPHQNEVSAQLRGPLHSAVTALQKVAARDRLAQDLRALVTFQLGRDAAQCLTDARVRGRPPWCRLIGSEGDLGGCVPGSAGFVPTVSGWQRLASTGRWWVEVGDLPKTGSVFCAGISSADQAISPGDEVWLRQGGALVGCGTAAASGWEMQSSRRGLGVRVRHWVSPVQEAETAGEAAAAGHP